MRLLPRL